VTMGDNRLDELIDQLLTFMVVPPWDVTRDRLFPDYPMTPQFFNGAEPLLMDENDVPIFHQGVTDDYGFFMDAHPDDLDGRVDVATVSLDGEGGDWREGRFAITRLRGLNAADVRGRAKRIMKHFVEVSRVWVRGETTALASRHLMGSNGDCRWTALEPWYEADAVIDREWSRLVQALLGVQFTRRYYWSVELGYVGLPALRFPTDPIGAREIFRLRDIPEGKARREALRHWVRAHWRRRREGGDPVAVREFLRGQTTFVWEGLRCTLRPSNFDRDRDALARAMAQRAQRAQRAGKVRAWGGR
jgi:hypothetical protein